ncbi:hypothetical protein NEFER03_1550 [Nematocida sp. LUAm3]|nr:hypothetical protein NEFER03_1550 [Nematocida sp. LUAm3]KAI5174583.1 hypothetical protein NEFER02_0704 [Nematocida sp. LUAm2]KAI5178011.1 hypothetical protein NEFER01_1193 [Nematocida sp. LUAm1]
MNNSRTYTVFHDPNDSQQVNGFTDANRGEESGVASEHVSISTQSSAETDQSEVIIHTGSLTDEAEGLQLRGEENGNHLSFIEEIKSYFRHMDRIKIISCFAVVMLLCATIQTFIEYFRVVLSGPTILLHISTTPLGMFINCIAPLIVFSIYIYLNVAQGNRHKPLEYKLRKFFIFYIICLICAVFVLIILFFLHTYVHRIIGYFTANIIFGGAAKLLFLFLTGFAIILSIVFDIRRTQNFKKNLFKCIIVLLCLYFIISAIWGTSHAIKVKIEELFIQTPL